MNLALRGTPLFSAADSGQDIAADTKRQSSALGSEHVSLELTSHPEEAQKASKSSCHAD